MVSPLEPLAPVSPLALLDDPPGPVEDPPEPLVVATAPVVGAPVLDPPPVPLVAPVSVPAAPPPQAPSVSPHSHPRIELRVADDIQATLPTQHETPMKIGAHNAPLATAPLRRYIRAPPMNLAPIPDFSRLRKQHALRLRGWRLGLAGAAALADLPELRTVKDLDLNGARIGDLGLARLLASPWLGPLVDLDLCDNELSAVGTQALAAAPALAGLRCLYLGQNPLDATAMEALAPVLPRLVELHLDQTSIGDAGAGVLARSGARPEHLRLALCELGAVGVGALVESGTLNNAASIGLGGNPIGDVGAATLSDLRVELGVLDLSYTGLGERGLASLLAGELLGRCGYVSLIGNPLGEAAYHMLLDHEGPLPGRLLLPFVDPELARALRQRTRVIIPNTPLAPGLVLACPYCREVIGLGDHVCRHCKAVATNDAGFEERPAELAAQPRRPCPHCDASIHRSANRCPHCASWVPPA